MATSKYDFFTMNVTSLSISARFRVYELQKAMWFSQLCAFSSSIHLLFLIKNTIVSKRFVPTSKLLDNKRKRNYDE